VVGLGAVERVTAGELAEGSSYSGPSKPIQASHTSIAGMVIVEQRTHSALAMEVVVGAAATVAVAAEDYTSGPVVVVVAGDVAGTPEADFVGPDPDLGVAGSFDSFVGGRVRFPPASLQAWSLSSFAAC
jgi:hypothetical protein